MNADQAYHHHLILINRFSPKTPYKEDLQWILNWLTTTSAAELCLEQYNIDKLLLYAAKHYMEVEETAYLTLFQEILEVMYNKGFMLSIDGLLDILFYHLSACHVYDAADHGELMQEQTHNITQAILAVYKPESACAQALNKFRIFLDAIKLYASTLTDPFATVGYDLPKKPRDPFFGLEPAILRYRHTAVCSNLCLDADVKKFSDMIQTCLCRPPCRAKVLAGIIFSCF